MKVSSRLFFIFCCLLGVGLSLSAQTKNQAYLDYIDRYSDIAVRKRIEYGIPASVTVAQGILESGAGMSELARSSNNHFGIKCHTDWTGERVYRKDDGPNDCFRKYKMVEESYNDHSEFLKRARYAVLFTYDVRDYAAWARGLQSCGYATDKGYANKLIKIIEDYELYKFDETKPSKKTPATPPKTPTTTPPPATPTTPATPATPPATPPKTPTTTPAPPPAVQEKPKDKTPAKKRDIYKVYNLLYVVGGEDDSLEAIARDTGFSMKDLANFNEIPDNFPINEGDIIYLQKKKTKADMPYFEHLVKVGESLHSISQVYGIQLSSLCKINKKDLSYIPIEGDVLRLR